MSDSTTPRPMNIYVAPGSSAETSLRGVPVVLPEAIAPGIPPAPAHDLAFNGGKIIPNLGFYNFYIGGSAAWQASDIQSVDQALAAAMSDVDLNNVMVQYFSGGSIASNFLGSQILPGPPPSVFSQGDVEALAASLATAGSLAAYDLTSTVFNFLLPSGTVLNTNTATSSAAAASGSRSALPHDEADSLNGLGGYHGSIHPTVNGAQATVYYAIGVYSEVESDGTVNGIPVFDQSWKNIVATFYHELNEARTDADVEDAIRAGNNPNANQFLGWISAQGEECGDYPVSVANPLTQVFQEVALANGSGTVPVQFQYSDAVHGPEGPVSTPDPPAPTGA